MDNQVRQGEESFKGSSKEFIVFVELEEITFKGVKDYEFIVFDNKEPVLKLTDILQPIVKVEKWEWLNEF